MIRVDPAWFLLFYLLLFLLMIFGSWALFESRRRRLAVRKREGTIPCERCGMVFVPHESGDGINTGGSGAERLWSCPRCGAKNPDLRGAGELRRR